jgi:large subunit ribosomal protein L25
MSAKTSEQSNALSTEARDKIGSAESRRARRAGRVPVEVYGHGQPNINLTVDEHALELALNTPAQVFMLTISGKDESCLVKGVQYDTFGQQILHVDFARVDLSEEVNVEVTLDFTGRAKGVVEDGGTMVVHHATVSVRCRADSIPELVSVDVSEITIGHALLANAISFPAGVALDEQTMDPETQIVGVVAPKVEEPEPEEVPAEGEEGAVPEAAAEGEAKPEDGEPEKPEKKEGD